MLSCCVAGRRPFLGLLKQRPTMSTALRVFRLLRIGGGEDRKAVRWTVSPTTGGAQPPSMSSGISSESQCLSAPLTAGRDRSSAITGSWSLPPESRPGAFPVFIGRQAPWTRRWILVEHPPLERPGTSFEDCMSRLRLGPESCPATASQEPGSPFARAAALQSEPQNPNPADRVPWSGVAGFHSHR
jgi:hypothetical protein